MLSCEMNIIKYILFIFNLFFAISGIGIILAGALVISDVSEFSHFMEGRLTAPPVILIVTGAIVFLVASLGCFGAIRESRPMLIAFAVCLLIIFILELAAGIAAACFKDDFQMHLKSSLKDTMKNYGRNDVDREAWDQLQRKLMCCGIDAPRDWYINGPDRTLPFSCCHAVNDQMPPETTCRTTSPTAEFIYQQGCYEKLEMKVHGSANVLIGVGIGIAFVEIIGIVLACWLASAIKKNQEEK